VTSGHERLVTLLGELRAELTVQDNPERRAIACLQPRPSGAVAELYAKEAFRIWEEMHRQLPDDLRTVHHLAIMHHARAFDLEASAEPGQADGDWKRALELWHRLWQEAGFWQGLEAASDAASPDAFAAVRAGWPERLLEVHLAIAWAAGTPNHRRRAHIRLALASPFPAAVKDAVRMRAYERATREVPAAAWEGGTFDPETLAAGIKAVCRYLDLDGELLAALKDLLALVTRLQTGIVQQINAAGEETVGFEAKLREMEALVRTHEARVSCLEGHRQELTPETLADLALWHARAGQARRLLHAYEAAADHYRRAMQAAAGEPSGERRSAELRREWLECTLLWAREHAAGGPDDEATAKRILAGIAGEELATRARLLCASVRLLVGDFDAAQRDAEAALAACRPAAEEGADLAAAEVATHLEPECTQLLGEILAARRRRAVAAKLEAARKSLEGADTAKALRLLDEAVRLDPRCVPALFQRAQCRLMDFAFERARRDLADAARLAAEQDDATAAEAIERLRREIEEAERRSTDFGGPEAFGLRQKAFAAYQDERFAATADLLRQALKAASPRGRGRLKKELAVCLDLLAVEKTNEAITALQGKTPSRPSVRMAGSGPAAGLAAAEALLAEAVALDPTNDKARGNLGQVREIRARLA